ncbi:transposase [Streptomyces sp. enrichment culture]|uniref:transposase n=1 Tax=Streptomyces sp. enrichment culture TaxID=1795815 RepID=UPI003F5604E5
MGIGPDTAVTVLITIGDDPERLGSEASLAALCGVGPSSAPRAVGSTGVSTAAATGKRTRPCTECADPPARRPAHPEV